MVRLLSIAGLAVWICGVSAPSARGAEITEVVLVGTLHGGHGTNPRYSLERLREMIVTLEPVAILVELPPTIGGKACIEKQRVASRLANDENWSANAAADGLQVPVMGYDREGRNEFYRETKYFDRQTELSRRVGAWREVEENRKQAPAEAAILGSLMGNANRSQSYFSSNSGPEAINSEGFDRIVRLKHAMWEELMPQLAARVPSLAGLAGEFAFFRDEWQERNRAMAENIVAQAGKWPGRRIVVLCGCEHRYILRDLLGARGEIRLREFYEATATGGSPAGAGKHD